MISPLSLTSVRIGQDHEGLYGEIEINGIRHRVTRENLEFEDLNRFTTVVSLHRALQNTYTCVSPLSTGDYKVYFYPRMYGGGKIGTILTLGGQALQLIPHPAAQVAGKAVEGVGTVINAAETIKDAVTGDSQPDASPPPPPATPAKPPVKPTNTLPGPVPPSSKPKSLPGPVPPPTKPKSLPGPVPPAPQPKQPGKPPLKSKL